MAEMRTERANRVAVQTTEVGYKADFYRTHKHLATMLSQDTEWVADENANKTAQREDFRKYAIEHSAEIGIEWNPADLRAEGNVRMAKYETDTDLREDTTAMLRVDIEALVEKCPHGVAMVGIEAEAIVPMTHTGKGTDLSKLGVLEGKYERSGNWAWAEVEVLVTLTKAGQEVYYTTKAQLVSGQLKKPHITQTSFNEAIKESLIEIGLWVEETKTEAEPVVEVVEEVDAENPTKKTIKSKKTTKKSKTATAQA